MTRKSCGRMSILDEVRKSSFLRRSFIQPDNTITKQEYMEILFKEKSQWNDLLLKSKAEASLKVPTLVLRESDVIPYFSLEDQQFWQSRPDYTAMLQTTKLFLQTLTFVKKMRQDYEEQCEEELRQTFVSRDALLTYLMSEKLCLKCNDGLCTEDIHDLPDDKLAYVPEYSSHLIDCF